MLTFECAAMNSSAHTELNGVTVFEPMILKDTEGLLPPAKTRTRTMAKTETTARGTSHFLIDLFKLLSSYTFHFDGFEALRPSIDRIKGGV
jgi:hypothetical protein